MKTMLRKAVIFIAVIVALILGITFIGTFLMMRPYDTGSASVTDVIAVNLGVKEYVVVDENDKYQRIMVKKSWQPETGAKKWGYVQKYQMGSGYFFNNEEGDCLQIVGTKDWCPLFRIYNVSIREKM